MKTTNYDQISEFLQLNESSTLSKKVIDFISNIVRKFPFLGKEMSKFIKSSSGDFGVLLVVGWAVKKIYRITYDRFVGAYVEDCKSNKQLSLEGMKLCILHAKIKANKETIKLLKEARYECTKIDKNKIKQCQKKFDNRIREIENKIKTLKHLMTKV